LAIVTTLLGIGPRAPEGVKKSASADKDRLDFGAMRRASRSARVVWISKWISKWVSTWVSKPDPLLYRRGREAGRGPGGAPHSFSASATGWSL
jgi:hypothetical protein